MFHEADARSLSLRLLSSSIIFKVQVRRPSPSLPFFTCILLAKWDLESTRMWEANLEKVKEPPLSICGMGAVVQVAA